jgi:CHAD domain-containing protein
MDKLYIASPSIPNELRRISSLLVNRSVREIKKKDSDENITIHNLRKHVKNLRALLRLIRTSTGEAFFIKYNYKLRDYNRTTAQLRNSAALIELFKSFPKIIRESKENDTKLVLLKLEADLFETRKRSDYKSIMQFYKINLKAYKQELNSLDSFNEDFSGVSKSLGHLYYSCRRFMLLSMNNPGEANLHEWRKAVKHLYYCCYSLIPLNRKYLKAYISELKNLSDLLGNIHDIYILKSNILSIPEDPDNFAGMIKSLRSYQRDLTIESFIIGGRLFQDKPGFISTIELSFNRFREKYSSVIK